MRNPTPFDRFLRRLGREVYGGFVPVDTSMLSGAEGYLPELWSEAPFRVALIHTLLAIVVSLFPLFLIGRPRRFGKLSQVNRLKMIGKMMRSRFYLMRLIAYGVKGHALVAVLRKTEVQKAVVAQGPVSLYGRVS
jgi:hypothetical protein